MKIENLSRFTNAFLFFLALTISVSKPQAQQMKISCRLHSERSTPEDNTRLFIHSLDLVKDDDGCITHEHHRHFRLQLSFNWNLFVSDGFGIAVQGLNVQSLEKHSLFLRENEPLVFRHEFNEDPTNTYTKLQKYVVYSDGGFNSIDLNPVSEDSKNNTLEMAIRFEKEDDLSSPDFFISLHLYYPYDDVEAEQILHCSSNY